MAWLFRHNMTFSDAVYVALTQRLGGVLLADGRMLANASTLAVPVQRLRDV